MLKANTTKHQNFTQNITFRNHLKINVLYNSVFCINDNTVVINGLLQDKRSSFT